MNDDHNPMTRHKTDHIPSITVLFNGHDHRYSTASISSTVQSSYHPHEHRSLKHKQQNSIIDEALLAAIPPSSGTRQYNSNEQLSQNSNNVTNNNQRLPSIKGLLQFVDRIKSISHSGIRRHEFNGENHYSCGYPKSTVSTANASPNDHNYHDMSNINSPMMKLKVNSNGWSEREEALSAMHHHQSPIMPLSHSINLAHQSPYTPPHPHKSPNNISLKQIRTTSRNSKKDYKCSVTGCSKAFPTKSRLNRHTIVHSGVKPFECKFPGCSKTFSRRDNMLQHYKSHNKV